MLAAVFVNGGIDTLSQPDQRVEMAEPVASKITDKVGPLPDDTETLVKINAVVQVVAGVLLALGWFRRLAAVLLAGSLVPTTLAGHRFWELDDPAARARQRTQFLKNLGLLGGLILVAVDTEGRPSVTWRARRAAKRAAEKLPLPIGG
jgi:uncharacterized membrane protein YphA (DoxX/SURF4 family)